MRKNNRVIFNYSVLSIVTSVVVALVMGFFINKTVVNYLILSHIELYPYIIDRMVNDSPELKKSFREEEFINFNSEVFFFRPSIFRVKIWNNDYKVLWSDKSDLIGRSFPNNETLARALSGSNSYNIEDNRTTEENATEQGEGTLFEFYIPVYSGGKLLGVVELYERNSALSENIDLSRLYIWLIIAGCFLVYYLLLFLQFYRSNSRLNSMVDSLYKTQDVTIFGLAYQAELRDNETGYHLSRTSKYVELIAKELCKDSRFAQVIDHEYISKLVKSAPLHDIGKVGIPDSILLKPGRLTEEEFEVIKQHPIYGAGTLRALEKKLPFQTFLSIAIELTECHHEKWNGSGYPRGLKGENIPLSGQIMALADVYDALRTERCYKKSIPHERCVEIIRAQRGEHFAPYIVDTFLAVHEEFRKVSIELSDPFQPDPN